MTKCCLLSCFDVRVLEAKMKRVRLQVESKMSGLNALVEDEQRTPVGSGFLLFLSEFVSFGHNLGLLLSPEAPVVTPSSARFSFCFRFCKDLSHHASIQKLCPHAKESLHALAMRAQITLIVRCRSTWQSTL